MEPFLAAFFVMAGAALTLAHLANDSATTDEPVHIVSAVEIVRDGTGRWNPEHPPLAKALAGMALIGLPLDPVPNPLVSGAHGPVLFHFLFENRTPGEVILFRARLPFVLLFAALILALRHEARARFGAAAGLMATGLIALEPNLIAHAGIVHTDLAVTLFLVLSLGPLRTIRTSGDRRATWLLGLFWGLAFLCKYDAPLLALVSLPVLFIAPRGSLSWSRTLGRLAGAVLLALLVSLLGFSLADRNQSGPDRDALARDRLLLRGRSALAAGAAIRAGNILPPAGNLATGALSILLQSRTGAGVNAFLGEVRKEGSPFYFPVALAVKISLGLAAAFLMGAFSDRGRPLALALGSGLLFFLALSATSTYNIGVRHVLFAFPFAALIASAAVTGPSPRRAGIVAAVALVFVQGAETLSVHPHELSFFNLLAGGPAGGRRFFSDSNLDWGQDLGRLASAVERYSPSPIPAIVFGGDLPRRYKGLRAVAPEDESREGGVIAIGETPLTLGPELLEAKGAVRESSRLRALRETLRAKGTRIGEIGGSIGIWRIGSPTR